MSSLSVHWRTECGGKTRKGVYRRLQSRRLAFPNPGPEKAEEEAGVAPGDSREAEPVADERWEGRPQSVCKALVQTPTSCVFPGSTPSTWECASALCPPLPQPWEEQAGRGGHHRKAKPRPELSSSAGERQELQARIQSSKAETIQVGPKHT